MRKQTDISGLEALREWATVRQLEYIDAIEKFGSQGKAAKSLDVNRRSLERSLESLKARAATQGHSPEHDMIHVAPSPFKVKGVSTYYGEDGKPKGQWVKTQLDGDKHEQALRDFVEAMAQDIKGLAPITPSPCFFNDDLMCVYPMGDPHFGLHAWAQDAGEDFDLKMAESLTCSAVDRLVDSAPPAHTALLLNLGDMFHADNQRNVTNSGHQLDVDGRWAKVQQIGLKAMLHCIKRLLQKHEKVIFRINKGNHDGHSSYALALMIACYFDKEPRVQVDLSPSVTWYHQFGQVLIGSTHGDTIKGADMLGVMAADEPKKWGETNHRYWYVGHVHHQDTKEYRGGVVEYFRTLAARDAWHAGQGYRAGRDMCLIVLHKQHGEVERHRCDIGMLK
jgi:hypothetical protein